MKLKMMIFLLIIAGCFYCNGMEGSDEEQSGITSSLSNNWEIIPDEVTLHVISFAVNNQTLKKTLQNLVSLKSVDKKFKRLSEDGSLLKLLIILHINDEDYQTILNKMLFRAARTGNMSLIELLKNLPPASREQKIVHIMDEQALDLSEVNVESKMREITDGNRVVLFDESTNHQAANFFEANINNVDEFGYTPILHAAERGHAKVLQALLECNAFVAVKNKDGDTALIMASREGFLKIVKKLLFLEGARKDINARGFGKDTAFLAAAKKCLYISDEIKENNYLAILRLFAGYGADVNALDAADLSAMDLATKKGNIDLINVLLDLDAHFAKQNKAWIDVYLLGMIKDERINELFEKIRIIGENDIVTEVEFDLRNEPYWLSFKLDKEVYMAKCENEIVQKEFVDKISQLSDKVAIKIGEAIIEAICSSKPDENEKYYYSTEFSIIFGQILLEPYWLAKENQNILAKNNIREIAKTTCKEYPNKTGNLYRYTLKDYEIDN